MSCDQLTPCSTRHYDAWCN